jgi:lysyl-tRNA synthetase class 2
MTKEKSTIPPVSHDASQEHDVRIQKVATLRERGIEAWPEFKPVNATCAQVTAEFKDDTPSRKYEVAGRVMAIRAHGKSIFAVVQDRSGKLQIYLKQDEIGDELFSFMAHFIDIGDIIWCEGDSFRTKMGEVTLKVTAFTLLSKSLHPLPEKFHGIADVETKYRQRYLDLISSPESRERFIKRSEIIKAIRNYLDQYQFIEVETPLLHPIPGGAAARPFVTHHNALDSRLYLRISPELYLKRLVVGGFERVYEIGRVFRNEGVSTKHNPEFTMLELYVAHHDYHWVMDFSEAMLKDVVAKVCSGFKVKFGQHEIDFGKEFERISMHDSIVKYAGIDKKDLTPSTIDTTIKNYSIECKKESSYGEKIFALFDTLVEPKLIQPTFITEFPVEISPLAKRDPNNPEFVNRFEMFVAGMELSNAFNELNDPFDQAERFRVQAQAKEAGDQEAHHYDEDYVRALEYALPPTVGFGMGIDRLVMLLTNTTSIKDVILFPTLKQK